jgi:hypothetical protein
MSPRVFRVLIGLSGVAGVCMLGTSFTINDGPPPDATTAQLVAFARQYFQEIVWGAWLQAVGTVLTVVFAFGVVYVAGAANRFVGWLTLFGGAILTTVSLVEIVFYFGALFPDPETMVLISPAFGHATQHLYFIVAAPALFLPLGAVIVGTRVLPRVFGYLALLLGALFFLAGIVSLTRLIVPSGEDALAGIQALWWLAAAITLIVQAGKTAVDKSSVVG